MTRDELAEALRQHRAPIVEADEWRPLAQHVLDMVKIGCFGPNESQREQTAATILAALVDYGDSRPSMRLKWKPKGLEGVEEVTHDDQIRVAYAVKLTDALRAELAKPRHCAHRTDGICEVCDEESPR